MNPKALIALAAIAIIVISWKTFNDDSNPPSKAETAGVKKVQTTAQAPLDTTIVWDDFKSDSIEFDLIRKSSITMKNTKTIYVRYDIDKLIAYLDYLKTQTVHGQNIDSVDLFLGKYVNAAVQPISGNPIPTDYKNKITVIFAGKGTSKESTPQILPYDKGDPNP